MKTFLIQTVDGQVAHDFSFHLVEAIKYQNWYHNQQEYDYHFSDEIHEFTSDPSRYIPVGSVEFVLDYYKQYHNIDNIKPINIPIELKSMEYTKRYILFSHTDNIRKGNHPTPMFVKSMDKIKGFTGIVKSKEDIPTFLFGLL